MRSTNDESTVERNRWGKAIKILSKLKVDTGTEKYKLLKEKLK